MESSEKHSPGTISAESVQFLMPLKNGKNGSTSQRTSEFVEKIKKITAVRSHASRCLHSSMRVLRRHKTHLLACCLALCLLTLHWAYYFTNCFDFVSYIYPTGSKNALPLTLHCNTGRLGNQMCTYATLYGICALNHRRSISLTCNIDSLKGIFVGPSRTRTLRESLFVQSHPWTLKPYLKPEDTAIPLNCNFLSGYKYPCSYTFFDHVKDDIRREFQFQDHITQYAQDVLRQANTRRLQNVTYIGVHVRRGDYNKRWLEVYEGVPVNMEYFRQALKYFRDKYKNVIFVAVSEDRNWCKQHLASEFGAYVPEEIPSPAHDLAILANCNHTVLTYGTFGFWGAYLAGGEVVYFDKFLKPNTTFTLEKFIFEKMYPPRWKGIVTVNASLWFQRPTTDESKNLTIFR